MTGPVTVQYGKDLTEIATVIGTGGVLAHSEDPERILRAALFKGAAPESLRPKHPRLLIDNEYALYAIGLLAGVAPDGAMKLAQNVLHHDDTETPNKDTQHDQPPAA